MDPKTRLLFSQLQLAGAGIVIGVMGFFLERMVFVYVGAAVLVYGLIRFLFMRRLVENQDFSEKEVREFENQDIWPKKKG